MNNRDKIQELGNRETNSLIERNEEQRTLLPSSEDVNRCSSLRSRQKEQQIEVFAKLIITAFLRHKKRQ